MLFKSFIVGQKKSIKKESIDPDGVVQNLTAGNDGQLT